MEPAPDRRASHLRELGLPEDCVSEAEIRAAYRRGALRLHPDKPGGDAEGFKRLQAAYDHLTGKAEPEAPPPGPPGGSPFGFGFGFDPFAAFGAFGFGPGPGPPPPPPQARGDVEAAVRLGLADLAAAGGPDVALTFDRAGPCDACAGGGWVPPLEAREAACEACGGSGQRAVRIGPGFLAFASCADCGGGGKRDARPPPERACATCAGSGCRREAVSLRMRLPEGLLSATQLSTPGQGNWVPARGARGDLLLRVEHDLGAGATLSPDSGDVGLEVEVSLTELLLGFRRALAPCGEAVELAAAPPADLTKPTRLEGRGACRGEARGGGRGALVLSPRLAPPTAREAAALAEGGGLAAALREALL